MSLPTWAPTTAEVAALAGAHARQLGTGYQGTIVHLDDFSDATTPTATQVQAFIQAACDEITGRAGVTITPSLEGVAHTAAKWFAVAQVHAERQPSQAENMGGAYRAAIANYLANLNALTARGELPSVL